MSDKFKYCQNCKRDIAAANYVIHSVHCERRIQLCNFCCEPVPITEMEQHLENTHTMVVCASCNMQMEKWRLEKHKDVCVKRVVSCKFCDLELTINYLDEHVAVCGTRTEKCPTCEEYVMKKDKEIHPTNCEKNAYLKSFKTCKFCELQFPIDYIGGHQTICGRQSEKCLICKEPVMLKDKENHSELCLKDVYFNIPVPCEYCEEKFPSFQLYEHSHVCGSRTQNCPQCRTDVMLKDITKHSYVCRPMSRTHGECRNCHEMVPWVDMNVHESYCRSYGSSDDVFKDMMPIDKTEDNQRIQKLKQCSFCDERLPDLVMSDHLKTCIERPYICELCLKAMPFKNKTDHLASQCKSIHQTPSHFSSSVEAYAAAAPVRTNITERNFSREKNFQICPHCNLKITEISFERHVKKCSLNRKPCQFCGMDILIEDEKKHLQSCLAVVNDFDKEPAFETYSGKKKNRKKNKNDKPDKSTNKKSWMSSLFSKEIPSSTVKEYIPKLPEVALLPCEFCEDLFPDSLIIEHQSGCRPDLVSFPPTEMSTPLKNQVVDDFAAANDPEEAIRLTGALPKTKNKFYTMNSSTRPEEFRDNNNGLPRMTGFERNIFRNPSSVAGRISITEDSQSEESKKILRGQHKKTLDSFMTNDHKVDAQSDDKKISTKNTRTMLFKFSTEPVENNSVSYQSDNPLPRAAEKSFQAKEFNTDNFQGFSTYRNSSTDIKKPLLNDLKPVGAERAEKLGIIQISRDTEIISVASTETLENYDTYNQMSQNAPDSGNKHEKEKHSSKFNYSEANFNIRFKEEIADLNEPEKVVTSQFTNQSLSEQRDKCSDFNENTLAPWEPHYAEDDVKNEETFGNDYKTLTEENFNENNLSDSEDNFYDAEESLKISNNISEDNTSSSLNKDSNLDAYFNFLKKDKDELVDSNNVQNDESTKRHYHNNQNCDCSNEICYCAIINQSPSSENNRFFVHEAGALTGASSLIPSSSEQFGENCTQPMKETSCNKIIDQSLQQNKSNVNSLNIVEEKKGSIWNKWRSKKSYDTDSD